MEAITITQNVEQLSWERERSIDELRSYIASRLARLPEDVEL